MLKRRFYFVLIGLVALMVFGSLSGPSSVNAVSEPLIIDPTKAFTIAALEEFTASSFTDTYNTFSDDSYAIDGDWGTAVYETSAVTADYRPVAYWSGFDSGGVLDGATITQVDIVIRISVSGTNNDEWGLILANLGSDTTLRAEATGDQSLTNLTYTDVNEPDDSSWSSSDVQGCQIDLDYDKITAADNFDIYIYEVCLKVTYSAGGTDYEKDLTETVTAADTLENAASFDRSYSESVTVADVISKTANFARNLVESVGVVGVLATLRGREKDLVETISIVDVRTFSIDYTRNFTEAITVLDTWSKTFGLNRSESIGVVDAGEFSKFISKNMTEVIGASDSIARSVDYSRELTESISVVDATTFSIDYARNLVESISAFDIIDTVKSGGIDYVKDLTEEIEVEEELETIGGVTATLITTGVFYHFFLSTAIYGYLGPVAVVILGYLIVSKYKEAWVFWALLEILMMTVYFAQVASEPLYWWHIFILFFGGVSLWRFSMR